MKFHNTFCDWAKDDRVEIWSYYGRKKSTGHRVYGVSSQFLKVFRPIFMKAFHCIREDHPTYRFPKLASHVVVGKNGTAVVRNPLSDERIDETHHMHEIITALKELVEHVLEKKPVPNNIPVEAVRSFLLLCKEALEIHDLDMLRKYGYFITLNPLIYTFDEWIRFLRKTVLMYREYPRLFQRNVKLSHWNEFPDDMFGEEAFEDVYYHYGKDDYIAKKAYPKVKAIKFIGDFFRHYPTKWTEKRAICEVQFLLPGLVPWTFYDMATRFCFAIKDDRSVAMFFGSTHHISNKRSLIYRLMYDLPSIISHNDLDFCEGKIVVSKKRKRR